MTKFTIELTDAQNEGIRKYLYETNGDGQKITKDDVKIFIINIVQNALETEAVNDYIQ